MDAALGGKLVSGCSTLEAFNAWELHAVCTDTGAGAGAEKPVYGGRRRTRYIPRDPGSPSQHAQTSAVGPPGWKKGR
jgi:hypothetical protein